MPGQDDPLDFCNDSMGSIQHKVRDSLRYANLICLEKRRPRQYAGMGGAVQRNMVANALQHFTTEDELRAARQVLAGAVWTKARAYSRKKLVDSPNCDYCAEGVEDEQHVFWRCKAWDQATSPWTTLVMTAAAREPRLRGKPIMEWPPCITQACIPPAWLETEVVGQARGDGEKTLIELSCCSTWASS